MKKILVLAVILSLSTVACNAFQDSYGNEGALSPNNAGEPPLSQPPDNSGNVVADYSADKTECNAIAEIKVVKSETAGAVTETVLAGSDEKLTTVVKKVGAYTDTITISSSDKTELLSITLKQTAEKEFSVCSVVSGDKKVKSGELTVDRFNDGADLTKSVNAGGFKIEFEVSADAVTAVKALAGASSAETVEGSYFAEGILTTEATK